MAAQLRHLLAAAERVSLRLVPIAAGPYPGGHDSFTILHFRRERPAVYRDDGDAGVFTDDDHTVHHYHATAHTLDTIALDHRATRQAITDAIESRRAEPAGNNRDLAPTRQPTFAHR